MMAWLMKFFYEFEKKCTATTLLERINTDKRGNDYELPKKL